MATELERKINERRANGYPRDRTRLPRRNWVEALVDALEKDEQSLWGLIIYRTTYSDEEGWTQFLRELEEETRDEFTRYNGLEELEQKANTVMDDASQFDGMTSLQVRQHCKQWISENFEREQGKPPEDAIYPYGSAPRYRYAIQIDEEALRSMTSSVRTYRGHDTGGCWVGEGSLVCDQLREVCRFLQCQILAIYLPSAATDHLKELVAAHVICPQVKRKKDSRHSAQVGQRSLVRKRGDTRVRDQQNTPTGPRQQHNWHLQHPSRMIL